MKWMIFFILVCLATYMADKNDDTGINPLYITVISFPADRITVTNGYDVGPNAHVLCGWWNTSDCAYLYANYRSEHGMTCHINSNRWRITSSRVSCNIWQRIDKFSYEVYDTHVLQNTCRLEIEVEYGSSVAEWNSVVDQYDTANHGQIGNGRGYVMAFSCNLYKLFDSLFEYGKSIMIPPPREPNKWSPNHLAADPLVPEEKLASSEKDL